MMYRFVVLDETYQTQWCELQSIIKDCHKSYGLRVLEMILVCAPFHIYDVAESIGHYTFG